MIDLVDHLKGREFWASAYLACQVGARVMSTLQMEEKETFKQQVDIGVQDRGYVNGP
jgi:hypothetical protein